MSVNTGIDLLDVVALTEDLTDRGTYRGQVGTVVENLTPAVFSATPRDALTLT